MATGYEDIDKLMTEQTQNLEQQKNIQNQIIDAGIQKVKNEVDKQKQEYEKEANKTAKGLYTNYMKQSNPYGATQETLASQGLANSGYAESSQVNLYNTYQKNVTEVINNTQKLKADADFQLNQAYLDADIQKAQNALAIYQQQAQLSLQEYDMKINRDQFEYQKQRDTISDNQYNEQFAYQKERDRISDEQWEKQYAYQQERDKVADSQWEKQYLLSLKKNSSSGSSGSKKSTKTSNTSKSNAINVNSNSKVSQQNNTQELSDAGTFLYNQIVSNSGMITENKARIMINSGLKNGDITQEEANIIRNKLGL